MVYRGVLGCMYMRRQQIWSREAGTHKEDRLGAKLVP